ncbi:paraquat-inducible protein A [Seleniivibrio sp.]|uniref:paraquat-inducible protein A n=1 Tax=Seleniivibrio sp. TaxID=2898801 RepID=UPI0025F27827|nr:paraquat-inducible protein A [Seleniivibrio sp.]MCD8552523.1 paraquat-inducible protein A [Seleniivibrio sp.]
MTDIESGVILCKECGTLNRSEDDTAECRCCGGTIHRRTKDSLSRTWALCITALILYIPANLYPIMDVQIMGESSRNTILGGVIQFFQHGMYFICAVVFVASFVVPLFKLSALFYILLTLRKGRKLSNRRKTRLYSIVELIGKWSMLDVFVVCIMAGLINVGYLLKITAGVGIVYFASVVIITMLASNSFDTRLIWDKR